MDQDKVEGSERIEVSKVVRSFLPEGSQFRRETVESELEGEQFGSSDSGRIAGRGSTN